MFRTNKFYYVVSHWPFVSVWTCVRESECVQFYLSFFCFSVSHSYFLVSTHSPTLFIFVGIFFLSCLLLLAIWNHRIRSVCVRLQMFQSNLKKKITVPAREEKISLGRSSNQQKRVLRKWLMGRGKMHFEKRFFMCAQKKTWNKCEFAA